MPPAKPVKPRPYVHQDFPMHLFNRVNGKQVSKIVHNEAECKIAKAAGWVESPADLPLDADQSGTVDTGELLQRIETLETLNAQLTQQLEEKVNQESTYLDELENLHDQLKALKAAPAAAVETPAKKGGRK